MGWGGGGVGWGWEERGGEGWGRGGEENGMGMGWNRDGMEWERIVGNRRLTLHQLIFFYDRICKNAALPGFFQFLPIFKLSYLDNC